jgi:hypothetical protein
MIIISNGIICKSEELDDGAVRCILNSVLPISAATSKLIYFSAYLCSSTEA